MPGIPAHRRSEETRRERRVRDRWCEKYQRSFAKPAALRSEIGPRLDRDSSLLSNSHSAGATVLYLCPVGRMSTRHCVPSIHGRNRRNQLHWLMPSLIKPADGATGPLSIWRGSEALSFKLKVMRIRLRTMSRRFTCARILVSVNNPNAAFSVAVTSFVGAYLIELGILANVSKIQT